MLDVPRIYVMSLYSIFLTTGKTLALSMSIIRNIRKISPLNTRLGARKRPNNGQQISEKYRNA